MDRRYQHPWKDGQEVSTSPEGLDLPQGRWAAFSSKPVGGRVKPAASPEAVQLQATSGCSQLERRGKLTSNGPRCGSNQRLVSGLRAEQKFRTCAGVPRRAPQLPSWLLGRGQRLVNRCQHPKKRTALLASSGYPRWHSSILAGIPGHGSSGQQE